MLWIAAKLRIFRCSSGYVWQFFFHPAKLLLALALRAPLFLPASGHAQRFGCTAPAPDNVITTDRPSFTDSSIVVPCHSLQMENGFAETSFLNHSGFDAPETLFRFGLTNTTEFRFTPPDYYHNYSTGAGFGNGPGDITIGMKQQLGPVHGFDVSMVPYLSIPTGTRTLSSHGYDPAFLVPWSRKLSSNWTAAGMFSVLWPTQGTGRNTTGQASMLFDRQLTTSMDAFVEYNGVFPSFGGPQHIIHFGTSYKLTTHQQVDFHVGWGLSAAAPDHFIGAGYSFRYDFKRPHLKGEEVIGHGSH